MLYLKTVIDNYDDFRRQEMVDVIKWPIGQYKQDQFVLYKSILIIVLVIMRDTTPGNGLCNQQGTQANIIVWLGLETKHPKNNETKSNTYEKRYARQWILCNPNMILIVVVQLHVTLINTTFNTVLFNLI